jgi:hypothetical protein
MSVRRPGSLGPLIHSRLWDAIQRPTQHYIYLNYFTLLIVLGTWYILYFYYTMTVLYVFCLVGYMHMYYVEHSLCNPELCPRQSSLCDSLSCWDTLTRGTRFWRKWTLNSNQLPPPSVEAEESKRGKRLSFHSVTTSLRVRTLSGFSLGFGYWLPESSS